MESKQKEPIGDWISREFDFLPAPAIQALAETGFDQIRRLDDPDGAYILQPTKGHTLFHPKDNVIECYVRDNPHAISHLGFFVFDSKCFGVLLVPKNNRFVFIDDNWEDLRREFSLRYECDRPLNMIGHNKGD